MDKKTKMLLGVGAVAVVGYLVWKNNQPKANLISSRCPMGMSLIDGRCVSNSTINKNMANAIGAKTEPKEVAGCRRACANSSDYINCMGRCLDYVNSSKRAPIPTFLIPNQNPTLRKIQCPMGMSLVDGRCVSNSTINARI